MTSTSEELTFRVMGFGTYGNNVKTIAILSMVFGVLFTGAGVLQLIQTSIVFVAAAFIVFGLIDLIVGVRMWRVGVGIAQAQQYRVEHQGAHPKDTVYTYSAETKVLSKTKEGRNEVMTQGQAPTYSVRKTSSRGGFAGYLFTLIWNGGSAVVMLGQDESEKTRIEQELHSRGIQAS